MQHPTRPQEAAAVAVEALHAEDRENFKALAAIETIRIHQYVPFTLTLHQTSGSDTTSEKLTFPVFETGWIYIITSICAIDVTDSAHQIRIGVTDGSTDLPLTSQTISNAGDSVDYIGQIMLKETDKVYAEFRSIGASDNIRVTMNGYKVRK